MFFTGCKIKTTCSMKRKKEDKYLDLSVRLQTKSAYYMCLGGKGQQKLQLTRRFCPRDCVSSSLPNLSDPYPSVSPLTRIPPTSQTHR